jgi:uncharacterized protein (TIGR04255 family)
VTRYQGCCCNVSRRSLNQGIVASMASDKPNHPKRLKRDTIYEVVFEVRFALTAQSASSLLPGLLYVDLKETFPRAEELLVPKLMPFLVEQNPMLFYQPTHALVGDRMRLLVGPRTMSISIARPYGGWVFFRDLIVRCLTALQQTGHVRSVERCSLKYTNVLAEGSGPDDLSQLRVSVSLDGWGLGGPGTVIRTEVAHRECRSIVQVITTTNVKTADGSEPEVYGVLLDIDTVKEGTFHLANEASGVADLVHDTAKDIFFSLLTPETLQRLGPEY